jgi:hypothetical protein
MMASMERGDATGWEAVMTTLTLRGALVALGLVALFLLQMSAASYAIDPGFGVGRAGPGVTWRGPAGVPGPAVHRAVPGAVVVAPAAPVVVAPGAYVAALPGGCVRVIVNGIAHWRCGGAVYRPVVQSGRTVYVVVR